MAYLNTHARTASATKNDSFQPAGRTPTNFGVFLGFVKDTKDVQKNGRIRVWIPEFGSAPENADGWIIANYCSPFAGATNVETTDRVNIESFDKTQTSYGMWFVPPDINNQVLIMFINGDPGRAIWIGSLYNQFMNNMVPGMAASTDNYQYHGKDIPVAEYNKWDPKVTDPDNITRPYEATKFKGIGNQGLINDRSRGVSNSSARRESPSSVFGILTPGPVIDENVPPANYRRKGGSAFIMDDGSGTESVVLTTKSGSQIKLDETNGYVYLINRDGTAWVQMDQQGNIDIFGATNISMRAQKDFNIRADRNINIEAGQNIFMKAAKDTITSTTSFTYDVNNIPKPKTIPYYQYVGEGNGEGGNIVTQALNNWQSTTQKTAYLTVVENNMNVLIGNSLSVTTRNGGQDYKSNMGIKLSTNAAVDMAATGNIRIGSSGMVSVVGITDVVLCSGAGISLNASDALSMTSANTTSITASALNVLAPSTFSGGLGVVGKMTAGGDIETGNIVANNIQVDVDLTVKGSSHLIADYAIRASGTGSIPSPAPAPISVIVTPPPDVNPIPAEPAMSAAIAQTAEIKPLIEKINILATWHSTTSYSAWKQNTAYTAGSKVIYNSITYIAIRDVPILPAFNNAYWSVFVPEDKFKRNSEALGTTVSRMPTYEPCPEHETFSFSSISGYTPKQTEGAKTYEGSGGAGNDATSSPVPNTDPGANNTTLPAPDSSDSAVTKDFNMAAYECQLKIHEGVKYVSYVDSVGLPTAGIGHLLRANEVPQYPVPTPVQPSQVSTWFQSDAPVSIAGAQRLIGTDVWGDLSDIRKRACADLCYNMGEGRLSKFKKFIAAMQAADYNAAGASLKDSKWYTQVGKRGPNIVMMIVQNIDPNGCDKKFPG